MPSNVALHVQLHDHLRRVPGSDVLPCVIDTHIYIYINNVHIDIFVYRYKLDLNAAVCQ